MTSPERWARVERILDELLDLTQQKRGARLDALTGDDSALRAEVLSLLEEGARTGGPLDVSLETFLGDALDVEAPTAPSPRTTVGPYRILRPLGRGGMGEVFLAERTGSEFEHHVALKIVRPGLRHEEIAERLRHERRILARLIHPNIAALYDGGTADDGAPFFVMEYVEGERITAYADRLRLDVDARVDLFASVCEAVSHAHRNLVIHRDLKPSNVLVTGDGTVKLLDFGIAKIVDPEAGETTQTVQGFLTPAYAAPEQLRALPATTATDVYSLGVLLYELLSGHHPHGDTSRSVDVMRAILEDDPRDPSGVVTNDTRETTAAEIARRRSTFPTELRRRLRGDLDNIVRKALRKAPEERYGSAEDLRADLERYRHSLPVTARAATARYRFVKFARRNRIAVTAATTLIVALVAFAVSMSVLYARSEASLARALEAEAAAGREAATAKQVSDFMVGLFRVSNPEEGTWESLTPRELLERAVERIETGLGDQPAVRARLLGTMGDVYAALGRYPEARRLLEEGIEVRREIGVENDADYPMALGTYAFLLLRIADHEGALRASREALSAGLAAYGPEHPRVALFTMNVGNVHRGLGNLDSSRVYLERSLDLHRKAFGPDHRAVATVMYNLAAVHLDRENYATARPLFEEVHRIWAASYGEDHMRTVSALGAIAGAMDLGGDAAGAREVQRRVVDLHEAALGPEHPEVGLSVLNLGRMERKLGDAAEAQALAERAHAIWTTAYGPDAHPRIAETLGLLADLRADAGETEAARDLARRGLDILDAAKLRTTETVAQLRRLGDLERTLGHVDTAAASFERAITIATEVFGGEHAEVAALRGRLEEVAVPAR